MTEPHTDAHAELSETRIVEILANALNQADTYAQLGRRDDRERFARAVLPVLLGQLSEADAEVARLREANESLTRKLAASVARIDRLEADVDRYNAQRDEARARVAELEAEAQLAAEFPLCLSNTPSGEPDSAHYCALPAGHPVPLHQSKYGTVWTEEDAAQRNPARLVAVPPTAPSDDHFPVYLDSEDQVWSDYPTQPPGDLMLPLVWASGQARSREDLEDQGITFRLIGWAR